MRKYLFFITASYLLTLSSCYSTKYNYTGNVHEQAVGKSKNEILRLYGIPDKTEDDGDGGKILAYEKYTQTTRTNAGAYNYGNSSTVGGAIYGNGGILGATDTRSGSISQFGSVSQSSVDKQFCYLFLNNKGICYDFKSNYGAKYSSYSCFDKVLTWTSVAYSAIFIIPLPITITLALIEQKKAKKNGNICN